MTPVTALTFGALLKRARRAAHLTQAELAERAGFSVVYISMLERGARQPPRKDAVALLVAALELVGEDRAVFDAAARRARRWAAPALSAASPPSGRPDASSASSALPTGTVTFLFSDIEGSTHMLQRLGPQRYAALLAEHWRLLDAAWAAHGGHEVDTAGDVSFVAFPTAPDALTAAAQAQRALASHAWPEGAVVRVRMGLHTGTAHLVGASYVGLDVHRAARIAAAGHGGQILLSQTTRDVAEAELPSGMALRDLGARRLKDLQRPEQIWQVVMPDLPADFPPLVTLDAHPHNLPIQLTSLLGREREVAALVDVLRRDDVRLVTLTGPGGIGKTRLGLQAASDLSDDFSDGVWLVRLSRLSDATLVIPTIARTLGVRDVGSQPIATALRAWMRGRRLLLVLDNCEQVAAAAPAVGELLASCPGLKVLATSRVALHLRGEREYPVTPLALPPEAGRFPRHRASRSSLADAADFAAVALFLQRAQEAQPTFHVTEATAQVIAAICARLDGLPLAIELAAARVRVLPPAQLFQRLERRLPLLTGGARDLEQRQQTMRNTLTWSEDLLKPAERRLFRRLAVFVGGWMLEAAEAVCAAPAGAEPLGIEVLEGLERLVGQSLVQQQTVESEGNAEAHFRLLSVVRDYALEQLETSGEAETLRHAHAAYYRDLAETAEPALRGPGQAHWLIRLDRELDNIRATLSWTVETGKVETGFRALLALTYWWRLRGYTSEAQLWGQRLLALASPSTAAFEALPPVLRARALFAFAASLWQLVDWRGMPPERRKMLLARSSALAADPLARAIALFEESLAILRAAGEAQWLSIVKSYFGNMIYELGDEQQATALLEEALAASRQIGDRWTEGRVLHALGDLALAQGDHALATGLNAEGLALLREVGDTSYVALATLRDGYLMFAQGNPVGAATRCREALTLSSSIGDTYAMAEGLETLGIILCDLRHAEPAVRALGAATVLRDAMGQSPRRVQLPVIDRAIATLRATLGDDTYAHAFEAGRTLPLEEAVAEALAPDGGPLTAARPKDSV
jgi:predicted ATPase/class 3 adenylate cyclase/predicted negative regulator of RcsB-dependent stress response